LFPPTCEEIFAVFVVMLSFAKCRIIRKLIMRRWGASLARDYAVAATCLSTRPGRMHIATRFRELPGRVESVELRNPH
jgi:hypothetical protein